MADYHQPVNQTPLTGCIHLTESKQYSLNAKDDLANISDNEAWVSRIKSLITSMSCLTMTFAPMSHTIYKFLCLFVCNDYTRVYGRRDTCGAESSPPGSWPRPFKRLPKRGRWSGLVDPAPRTPKDAGNKVVSPAPNLGVLKMIKMIKIGKGNKWIINQWITLLMVSIREERIEQGACKNYILVYRHGVEVSFNV